MCNLKTEGTKHGCGHYIITRKLERIDCRNRYCIHSDYHLPNCPHCPSCDRYLGPDVSETITRFTQDYCIVCAYWYQGPGSKPR